MCITQAVGGPSQTSPCGSSQAVGGPSQTSPCGSSQAVGGSSQTSPCGSSQASGAPSQASAHRASQVSESPQTGQPQAGPSQTGLYEMVSSLAEFTRRGCGRPRGSLNKRRRRGEHLCIQLFGNFFIFLFLYIHVYYVVMNIS